MLKLYLYHWQLVSYLIGGINTHTSDHDLPLHRSSEEASYALAYDQQEDGHNESTPLIAWPQAPYGSVDIRERLTNNGITSGMT